MNLPSVISGSGPVKCHSLRLHRGTDLMGAVKALCKEKHIAAGVVLSAVGCISRGRVRDASGVTIRDIEDHCEIVSLNGTVSTCELVIAEIPGTAIDVEFDPETGYDELIFQPG